MKSQKHTLVALALVLLSSIGVAAAQDPANERATEFQAVEGRSTEDVSGLGMMVASYAIVWLVLLGYVVRIAGLSSKTSAELDRLEKLVAEGDGPR